MLKNIGYIYKITAPNGKSYIGQTIDIKSRWNAHKRDAKSGKNSCPLFHRAITKYGWDNFTKEIILAGDINMLNIYETAFIFVYNTVGYYGYNSNYGGDNTYMTIATRQKKSDAMRIYKNYELPIYVVYYKKKKVEGFRVKKPGTDPIIICSMNMTMEEKYKQAIKIYLMDPAEYNKFLQKHDDDRGAQRKIDPGNDYPLPKYVTYRGGKYESFSVRYPQNGERKFAKSSMTKREKYEAALAYLKIMQTNTK
jgi:group I intron endonuclease